MKYMRGSHPFLLQSARRAIAGGAAGLAVAIRVGKANRRMA